MRRRRCIEYLLAVPHYAFEWELFQRFDKSDRRVIDGWRLDVVGVLPLSLDGALAEVRVQWTEEFLELEGSSRGIAAYWEEWGGAAQAERIHGILMALRDSADSHGTIQQAATPDGG